ncbi:MAG TPA: Na(+)-translocating NADH-quinone reductase subunit C [Candidatus Avibacteroides excrementipullorum]|nr:Na(+)-translocating NADH-quinone reductase subunit C [Candidatus Avibacteroides excrementipullorum]
MNTNSNTYTIVYAAVMVIVVAFLLAFVNASLKSKQEENIKQDTKKQILAALNIREVEDVNGTYSKVVKEDRLITPDGELGAVVDDKDFATSYEKEVKDNNRVHIFVCDIDGQTKYVIPVYGVGLWGAIWGYVALNDDKNTVYGTYFSHSGETPGLGAEIATEMFQKEFIGKHALNENEIALSVVKNGKAKENPEFYVDGISGGTITSNGVDAMLKNSMSNYIKFLTKK